MTPEQKTESKRGTDRLLAAGLIVKSTVASPAPAFFETKSGKNRFCMDLRAANEMLPDQPYPLPRIDEIIREAAGHSHYAKMDLATGFHNLRIAGNIAITAFVTPHGVFECLVCPIALKSAPTAFHRWTSNMLAGLPGVIVYLDEILVYADSPEEYRERLSAILSASDLVLRKKKFIFIASSVDFVGHFVSSVGSSVTYSRSAAVAKWALPASQMEIERFLGFAGYSRNWVPGFTAIASPLQKLVGAPSKWPGSLPPQALAAFRSMQRALISPLVLVRYDHTVPTVLQSDASGVAWGYKPLAVLSVTINNDSSIKTAS